MAQSSTPAPAPADAARLILSLLIDVLRHMLDVDSPAADRLAEIRPLLAEIVRLLDVAPSPEVATDDAARRAFDRGLRWAREGGDPARAVTFACDYFPADRALQLEVLAGILAAADDADGR